MNKHKTELQDQINKLLGLLISLRTVENSPLQREHWVNYHIDKLSSYRNSLSDNEYDCKLCDGSGGVYDSLASSLYDAECCPECYGNGFDVSVIREHLKSLKEESENKSSTIFSCTEEMLSGIIFKI